MAIHRALAFIFIYVFLSSCSSTTDPPPEKPIQEQATDVIKTPSTEMELDNVKGSPMPPEDVAMRATFGGPLGEVATSVIELPGQGFLMTGYTYNQVDALSTWDALIMRVSMEGQLIWRKTSGMEGSDYAWAIRPAQDGKFIVVGTREGELGDSDGYMEMIDINGNQAWLQTYGGAGDDVLWAAEPLSDGGFLLAGETNSEGEGGLDFFVIRTDAEGQEIWSKSYGTELTDRAFGIGVDPDDGTLVVGFTGVPPSRMNFFMLRLDADGRERWRRTIAGDRFDVAHDVVSLADGGFVISGYSSSFSLADHDGMLMRLNAQGRLLWMKTYGDSGDDRILHVAQMNDGGFAMIGNSDWDLTIWRVDEGGDLIWSHRDGGYYTDVGKDLVISNDGSIVAVGGNRSENPPLDNIILLVLREPGVP